MRISGGTITPYTAKIVPSFKPITRLALDWVKLSNGNYSCVDRSASSDVYESDIEIYGREDVVQNFFTAIQQNRADDSHVLTLDEFNEGEKIFGADIDYSVPINATVLKLRRKQQETWKSFSLSFLLRATNLTFTGTAAMPALKPLVGFDGDSDFQVDKRDSYFGDLFFSDMDTDAGTFTATYHFTQEDMKSLRRFLAVYRASTVTITSLAGVVKPFGNRITSFPIAVKIISWEDLGMITWGINSSVRCWALRMTMAEVV